MPGGGRMRVLFRSRAAGSLHETHHNLSRAVCALVNRKAGTSSGTVAYPGEGTCILTRREQNAEVAERPFNNLLLRLNAADYALLEPHFATDEAKAGEILYNPGDNVQTVYFPCEATLVSYMVPNEDGRDVETVLIGREGAVGGIVSQGFLPAYTRISVKFGGPVVRLGVAKLDAAKSSSPSLRQIFARYADCMLAQIFQSTACNAIHSIEQRTAKWIVSAMERTNGNNSVPLTHEQLATLLGVGRSYASRVIQTFKAQGVLDTRRGAILVREPEALKLHACMCNEAVKTHFEEVLRGVYPDPDRDN